MFFEKKETEGHTFDSIVGQQLVKRFLLRACEAQRLPQALLFAGPAGVGKRSLMYALAKHLVAADYPAGSEEVERAHGKVERGVHPDVMVIMPKSASGQILRAQIDELHDRAHYAPLESSKKVILIAPVEALNEVAANDLLKLLEEPPPAVHMLLASQQINLVLNTVRSRCALLRCGPIESEALTDWLSEATGCPLKRAQTAARLSGGRPGLALELVSGEDAERRRSMVQELEFFDQEGYLSVFRVAHNLLAACGGNTVATMTALLSWFRDLLIASLESAEGREPQRQMLINSDLSDEIIEAASRHTPTGLAAALEKILENLQHNSRPFLDPNLVMQMLLTDLGVALKKG